MRRSKNEMIYYWDDLFIRWTITGMIHYWDDLSMGWSSSSSTLSPVYPQLAPWPSCKDPSGAHLHCKLQQGRAAWSMNSCGTCKTIHSLYTVHLTVNTVYCKMYTVNCILYTVTCPLYTVHCKLYVYCTMSAVHGLDPSASIQFNLSQGLTDHGQSCLVV